jgi:hypothetical protein
MQTFRIGGPEHGLVTCGTQTRQPRARTGYTITHAAQSARALGKLTRTADSESGICSAHVTEMGPARPGASRTRNRLGNDSDIAG